MIMNHGASYIALCYYLYFGRKPFLQKKFKKKKACISVNITKLLLIKQK